MGAGRRTAALGAALIALALPCAALAAFPGADPAESPRANTPNDPGFDRCEADDPDTPPADCDSYFEEQFGAFGFSPDSATSTGAARVGATQYVDCAQLDAAGPRRQRRRPGDPAVLADRRRPRRHRLEVLDRRSRRCRSRSSTPGSAGRTRELVDKVRLNTGELPLPQHAERRRPARSYDCNGDGAFNVRDYADDPRVSDDAGDDTEVATRSSTPPT